MEKFNKGQQCITLFICNDIISSLREYYAF